MCGLVGMAGNVVEQDKKALMALMRLDVVRGWDSTGLAVVTDKDSEINVYKQMGPPEYLFAIEDRFDGNGVYNGPSGKVFIGHNRAATKGAVEKKNAHPFQHDGVVGAHNGTLISVNLLENGNKFDVDSEAIFYNFSQFQNPEDVIENIWGAYALTWYDDATEKLYVIRNDQRPLFYTRRTDNDVIYWASQSWMLLEALKAFRISHGEIKSFDVNTLYSLDVSDCRAMNFRKTDWETKKDVFGYKPPPPKVVQKPSSVHGGSRSNVHPFVGGKASNDSSRSNSDIMMMKMLVDTTVLFKFSGVKKGMGNTKYLHAYPANYNLDYDIRIYGEGHNNWDYWKSIPLGTIFKGRIKRLVDNRHATNETYFLIDLRSIVIHEDKKKEESEPEVNDNIPFEFDENKSTDTFVYEGFQGRYLTETEWLKATRKGCAGCGDPASKHDCDLVFIDHDEFLCGVNGCNEAHADFIPAGAYK